MRHRDLLTPIVFSLAVIAASAGFFSSTVQADLIIGNYDAADTWNGLPIYDTSNAAVGFQMGAESYSLDSLLLRLNYLSGSPIVQLRSTITVRTFRQYCDGEFHYPRLERQHHRRLPLHSDRRDDAGCKRKILAGCLRCGLRLSVWYRLNSDWEPSGSTATFLKLQHVE